MLSLFRYLSVTSITTFGNWDSSSARFARRRTLGKNIELSKVSKFKMLLYLKKSGLDKQGKATIMGRITLNRSNLFACQSKNSMAQFS